MVCSCSFSHTVGGLAVAEFAGKAYLPTLVAILEKDAELHRVKLVS